VSAPPALAEELGRFIARFRLEDSEQRDALLERARWHLLDVVGLGYAGWRAEDRYLEKLAASQSLGSEGPCTVIGASVRADAERAAWLNAASVHTWDFDDVDLTTVMHCESFAVGAVLPLAEELDASGLRLAEATLVAMEVALRLASAPDGAGGLLRFGFHPTAVFGAFGAAAGAARLLGLDEVQAANALAFVASFTSGTAHGWALGSGRNKPIQVGWAARAGVAAARLAEASCTCSLEAIEGTYGTLHAHTHGGPWTVERVLDGLGQEWRLEALAIKLFPCGGIGQGTAECMQELHRLGVRPDDVRSGTITMPYWMEAALTQIGEQLHRPTSGSSSIGAVPCIGARVLMEGTLRLQHLTDAAVRDPDMLALADRLSVEIGAPVADGAPDEQPVHVQLDTGEGRVEWRVVFEGGHPQRLTKDRVVQKFHENVEGRVDHARAAAIEAAVFDVEHLVSVRALTGLIAA